MAGRGITPFQGYVFLGRIEPRVADRSKPRSPNGAIFPEAEMATAAFATPPRSRLRRGTPGEKSIPNVALIEFDPVALEKQPKFLLKRSRPMVLFLVADVVLHLIAVGVAD